jgi:hypothetical protein
MVFGDVESLLGCWLLVLTQCGDEFMITSCLWLVC